MLKTININEYKTNTARYYIEMINELVEDMADNTSKKALAGEYFCGNKASDYAIERGYLDYGTLAKSFDAVLCNSIAEFEYYAENGDMFETWTDWAWRADRIRNEIYTDINTATVDGETATAEELDELACICGDIKEYCSECADSADAEIFQYYIISDAGAEILKDWTDEIVLYVHALDIHVWGVTHYGTSWSHVLTNIKLNDSKEA